MKKIFFTLLFLTHTLTSLPMHAEEPVKTENIATPTSKIEKEKPTSTPPYFQDEEDEKKELQVEQPHFSELLSRMLIMLIVTIGGFALFAWFAKKFLHTRMQGLNRQGRIQILEQRALSQKSALYIIKVDAKEYLITESASGIHTKEL